MFLNHPNIISPSPPPSCAGPLSVKNIIRLCACALCALCLGRKELSPPCLPQPGNKAASMMSDYTPRSLIVAIRHLARAQRLERQQRIAPPLPRAALDRLERPPVSGRQRPKGGERVGDVLAAARVQLRPPALPRGRAAGERVDAPPQREARVTGLQRRRVGQRGLQKTRRAGLANAVAGGVVWRNLGQRQGLYACSSSKDALPATSSHCHLCMHPLPHPALRTPPKNAHAARKRA